MSSVESSVDRLLPPSLSPDQLPLDREVARSIVSKVLNHLRQLPDIKTVDAAQKASDDFAESIRQGEVRKDSQQSSHPGLGSMIVSSLTS